MRPEVILPGSTKIDFTVPLPDFKCMWTTLIGKDIIILCHSTGSLFLQPSLNSNVPSATVVLANQLLVSCPPSLLQTLKPTNSDHQFWLDSYRDV